MDNALIKHAPSTPSVPGPVLGSGDTEIDRLRCCPPGSAGETDLSWMITRGCWRRGSGFTEEKLGATGGWGGGNIRQWRQHCNITEELPGWQLREGPRHVTLVPESPVTPHHAQDQSCQALLLGIQAFPKLGLTTPQVSALHCCLTIPHSVAELRFFISFQFGSSKRQNKDCNKASQFKSL